MKRTEVLGAKAAWGAVGYTGEAFAPARRTYAGVDGVRLNYTTVADSGRFAEGGSAIANLYPLLAAALYEAGFAREAGPLTTWSS
jgi:hypothetical protein